MRKAVLFDEFAYQCPFFTGDTAINNGYGCKHPGQQEREEGETAGGCHCYTCPLGIEAEQEDTECPEKAIDWDGLCKDGEVAECECLLIDTGEMASEEQKEALREYEEYLHRYDKEYAYVHNN